MSSDAYRMDFSFLRQSSPCSYSCQRRGSVESLHSTGETPNTTSGSWASAVLERGQNAISTILQPPIARTGLLPDTSNPTSNAYKPPTSRDIPPVTLTNITHVDVAEFKPYLIRFSAIYEQLRILKESGDEAAVFFHDVSRTTNEFATVFDNGDGRPGKRLTESSVPSMSAFSRMETCSPIRGSTSVFSRKATQEGLLPLSTIPTVYFDKDFQLANPRIFDVVSERSEVVRPPKTLDAKENAAAPRKALATNAILQEKLSWYLDTIEMHLIASISTASNSFFTALVSLQQLHSEAADCVERIRVFRKELEVLNQEIAASGLEIVQKRQRRENLQQLYDATLQLKLIVDGITTCEAFIDNGELEKAIESIDSLQKLVVGDIGLSKRLFKSEGQDLYLRDLRRVTALQGVNNDMSALRFRIGKAYEARYVGLLIGDLRLYTQAVSTQEVLVRWNNASVRSRGGYIQELSLPPSYMSLSDSLRSQLLESMAGLYQAKHLTAAITTYREAVLEEIRSLVQQPLPSSTNDDNDLTISWNILGTRHSSHQQNSAIPACELQALNPKDAEELLVKIYISVTEILRRLATQVRLMLDIASSLGDEIKSPNPAATSSSIAAIEAREIHGAIDLPNLLEQAVDIAQDKIVKLLRVRSQQSTQLSLIRFLRYFTLNLYFANECESISGRSGKCLKTVVNGHIRDFIQQYSDTEKQKLTQAMESDQWEATDFSEKDIAELSRILYCSTKDPAEWLDGLRIWFPYADDDPQFNRVDQQSNSHGKARTKSISIDEETFVLPKSSILCMHGISHFLQLIVGIPSMTSDIGALLVSYLRLFNTHCAQLILGARARRSAGLKNITSKHLALTLRALAFIATLIGYIREFVRRHIRGGDAAPSVVDIDKVKRLYQEHQNNIYDKLVEIMSRLAASHVRAIENIDWDNDQENVHPYMAELAKNTTSLHRILTKTLPEGTVCMLMTTVFACYKDQLGKAFQEVDPKTELGRTSMLRDVEFFMFKLGKIVGCGDTGQYLTTIIKSREVKSKELASLAAAAENMAESAVTRDGSEVREPEGSREVR